jgi:hypothetical protein
MVAPGTLLGSFLGTRLGADLSGFGAPAPFDPSQLAPFAWWRGDTTDTATNFDWLDKSGNGHILRQATAADKPTIVTPAEIGGQAALRFDGVSDFLASTEAAPIWTFLHAPGASGCEMHSVCVPRALPANGYFHTTQQGGQPFHLLLTADGGTTIYDRFQLLIARNDGSTVVNVTTVPVLAIGAPVRLGVALIDDGGPNEYEIFVNAASMLTAGGLNFGTNAPANTLTLCKRPGMLTQYMQLDYAELIVFNRELLVAERAQLNAYFVARYGL